jgi:hypothetical protein
LLVDARVAIGDHGDLAGLLAYEDLCDLEAFLGQLLSPWVMHAERHGRSYPLMMDSTANDIASLSMFLSSQVLQARVDDPANWRGRLFRMLNAC